MIIIFKNDVITPALEICFGTPVNFTQGKSGTPVKFWRTANKAATFA